MKNPGNFVPLLLRPQNPGSGYTVRVPDVLLRKGLVNCEKQATALWASQMVHLRFALLAALWSSTACQCHFEDSDGNCWEPEPPGVCHKPPHGASALIQHADDTQLCARDPPYGFQAMCTGDGAKEALQMIHELRDPPTCHHRTCALVGASGTLLGARLGAEIDKHDAVIRINFAPDGNQAASEPHAPHTHGPTWVADIGARTTWRVLTMEGYGYLRHYPRFWLKPPKGHGVHDDMSGIPQHPYLAITCHTPSSGHRDLGRCRVERLRQVFAHASSASYLINPVQALSNPSPSLSAEELCAR